MEIISELQKVWPLVGQATGSFIFIALTLLAIGWGLGRFMYGERIQTLRERLDAYKEKLDGASPDEARQRLEVLEAQVRELSPRRLTTEQIQIISRGISGFPGMVYIKQDMAAADARALSASFAAAFTQAGWQVRTPSVMGISNPPPSGVGLRVIDLQNLNDRERCIRDGLVNAKVLFDLQPGGRGQPPEYDDSIDAELLITTKGT